MAVLRLLGILQSVIERRVSMCFGGKKGPSVEELYQQKKVDFGPLPSLSMTRNKQRKGPVMKDVVRRGAEKRSLLNPYMTGGD